MKKILSLALATIVGLGTAFNSYGTVLHTIQKEQTLTKGANFVTEQILTDQGWLDVYLLKINLEEQNISLKPIESSIMGERETILKMAQNSGALAAVNADYFDMQTKTPSFGPVISEGQLKHGYTSSKVGLGPALSMATFMIDNQNTVLMQYFGTKIGIYANGNKVTEASGYNNIGSHLSIPVILDTQFHKDNATLLKKFKGIYTIAVENDSVTYQSKKDELVKTPENGYLIVMDTNNAALYYPALKLGDLIEIRNEVVLNNQPGPEISNVKIGIGGGGLIMKDSQPYQGNAHKVSPSARNPRTLVATTYTPNEVLLIGIDGRGQSIGVTHNELLNLLKKYNVKDAMYLDGGGSTTVVARNEGKKEVTVQNRPSEGSLRKVVNGIGVFSNATPGTLSKIYIDTSYNRSFIGQKIAFSLRGTDENDNPIDVPKESISLSVTGLTGTWKGFDFYPETEGNGLVIATVNGVEVATEIHVEKEPMGLRIEPSNLHLPTNSSQTIQVYGIDKDGYKVPLTTEQIIWESNNQSVTANQNKIISTGKGIAILNAKYKNATGKVGVVVGDTAVPLESFEQSKVKWASNTSSVKGKVEPCKDLTYHGERSLKMTYTFEKGTNKQVAYTVLSTPIPIPQDANAFNMWVYGKNQGDPLKAIVVDAKGKTHYIKLVDSINFNGWKYTTAPLSEEISLPAKVTKLYTYSNSVEKKRTSAVYFDHSSITRGHREKAGIAIRDDYRLDVMYKDKLQEPNQGEYFINAIGTTKMNGMILGNEVLSKMANKLSQNAQMILEVSHSNEKMNLGSPTYTYQNKYQQVDSGNTKVVFVATDKGGIRATASSQWNSIKASLQASTAKHIMIVMGNNPLTQFQDQREGKAFHDYLREYKKQTGKNIFIMTPGGTEPEVRIEDGIRYIRTNGISTTSDNIKDATFVKFKVIKDNIYYTFESVN